VNSQVAMRKRGKKRKKKKKPEPITPVGEKKGELQVLKGGTNYPSGKKKREKKGDS